MKSNKKGRKRLKEAEKRVLVHVYIKRKFKKELLKIMKHEVTRLENDGSTDTK